MKNLIKKILKEEDDWDWAREITEHTLIADLRVGQRLEVVEMDEELLTKVISECDANVTPSDFEGSYVLMKERMERYETLCDCEDWYDGDCNEIVDSVHLSLGNDKTFWVFDDMIKFHPTN